jgi:hypothetical protein
MGNYTSLKTKLTRFFNLIWVTLFASFTRRRVNVYLLNSTEAIPGEPMGCMFSWCWEVKFSGMRRRANTTSAAPQAVRQYAIATGIQLAEELIKFTYHLADTAVFIHLEERDVIPLIIREEKIAPARTCKSQEEKVSCQTSSLSSPQLKMEKNKK